MNILVVDDAEEHCEMLCENLCHWGFGVRTACSNDEALGLFGQEHFDLITSDFVRPRGNGAELAAAIRRLGSSVPIVILSGCGTIEQAGQAMKSGASDFIAKPVAWHQLWGCLQIAQHKDKCPAYHVEACCSRLALHAREEDGGSVLRERYAGGGLLAEWRCRDGRKEGVSTVYNRFGAPIVEQCFSAGIRHGTAKWYWMKQVYIIDTYEQGARTSRKVFDRKGQLDQHILDTEYKVMYYRDGNPDKEQDMSMLKGVADETGVTVLFNGRSPRHE